MREARQAALVPRSVAPGALQSTQDRLAPVDALAEALLGFIQHQVELGKVPNLSMVRTYLQSAELAIKTTAVIESREVPAQRSGLLEAGETVRYLREHYPDALRGLAAHLGAAGD